MMIILDFTGFIFSLKSVTTVFEKLFFVVTVCVGMVVVTSSHDLAHEAKVSDCIASTISSHIVLNHHNLP